MNIRMRRMILDPIRAHYDKIIVFLAVALLVVTASSLVVRAGQSGRRLEQQRADLDNKRPLTGDVKPVPRDLVARGRVELAKPVRLAQCTSNTTLFVPEERVSCPHDKCRKPIPFSAEKCPFCFQPVGGTVTVNPSGDKKDSDGDGMVDSYEAKYKLNQLDASDASIDVDNDGYTSLQEFEAGKEMKREFDPTDKNSLPPAWWGSNLVVRDAKALEFNLRYMSSMRVSGSNWLHLINEVGGPTHAKKIGESVIGFKLLKYEEKFVWVVPENMVQKVKKDVSELTLESPSGIPVILVKGEPKLQWERSADLYYLPQKKKFTVKEGEWFEVGAYKYRVKDIDAESKKVLISDSTFEREVWVASSSSEIVEPAAAAPAVKKKEIPAAAGDRTKPAAGKADQPAFEPFEKK